MKTIYLVRHGESKTNAAGVFGGDLEAGLTERGEKQAHEAAKTLQSEYEKPDLIIASPMLRTLQTAKIIARELGLSEDETLYDDRIMEVDSGEFDGRLLTDENRKLRDQYYLGGMHVLKVESESELLQRITSFAEELKKRPEDVILVVGHGFSGRALRRIFAGMLSDKLIHQMGNGAVLRLYPSQEITTGDLML